MKNWFSKNYKTVIVLAFLIPIITVAVVSISHVTKWFGISNPISWAVYLSFGIEIAALSALAAISAQMGKKVYFPFGLVTLIQFIGNIYFAYDYINITSESFVSWVELTAPLLELMGVDATDMVGHRRFLAVFAGGILPFISLSFLHMLVQFTEEEKAKATNTIEVEEPQLKLNEDDFQDLEKILTSKTPISRESLIVSEPVQEEKPHESVYEKSDDFHIPEPNEQTVPFYTDEEFAEADRLFAEKKDLVSSDNDDEKKNSQ
jgi:hypothetical protein